MKKTKGYVTIAEAAKITGYADNTIRSLQNRNRIGWDKLSNGAIMVCLADVVKYAKAHPPKFFDLVWDGIDLQEGEGYFPLKGYDYMYFVTTLGRVGNLSTGEFFDRKPTENGYIRVGLEKDGKTVLEYAHDLVARTQLPNTRFEMYPYVPNGIWEVHHIHIGFEFKCQNAPEGLLWVLKSEHLLLHRLWDEGKKKEYWDMIEKIRKENHRRVHKIPHLDFESSDKFDYFMWVDDEGFEAYNDGKDVPITSIVSEFAEYKGEKKVVEAAK